MRHKLIISSLVALLLSLQYALWFGDKSVPDLLRLHNTAADTRHANAALLQGNGKLVAEVVDLKEGGETVETLARAQFGLIREGETFYQIVEE